MAEGGKLQTLFIASIIFTLFIVGGIAMMNLMVDVNPVMSAGEDYAKFNDTFNKIDDVTDETATLEANVKADQDTVGDWGALGVLNSLIAGAWNSLKFMFGSFTFLNDVFTGLTSMFGIPSWIPTLFFMIITVVISFAIYSAIFNRNP